MSVGAVTLNGITESFAPSPQNGGNGRTLYESTGVAEHMTSMAELYGKLTISEFANAAVSAGTTPWELLARLDTQRGALVPGE